MQPSIPNKNIPLPETYTLKQTIDFIRKQPSVELTVYLIVRLESKQINPDILLNAVIDIFSDNIDLFYLSLAIRFGANVNKFVETNRGKFHPLAALGLNSKNKKINQDFIAQGIAILIVSGSKIDSKASFLPEDSRTVINFYKDNNLDTEDLVFVSEDLKLEKMDPEIAQNIAILLNREDLITLDRNNLIIDKDNNILVIESFSNKLYKYIDFINNISFAIEIYNSGYIEHMVKNGVPVTYLQVNEILLKLKQDKKKGNNILTQIGLHEIGIIVKYGARIDKYQDIMLLSIVGDKINKIRELYKEPRWIKECRNTGPPSVELKRIAIGLKIEDTNDIENKAEICKLIKEYSTKANNPTFGKDQVSCANSGSLDSNPKEYPALGIVKYSSKGKTYCLPAELYDTILSTEINPFNNEPIPENILDKIKDNRDELLRLNINHISVPKFSETLAKLKQPDKIVLDKEALNDFRELARLYKINVNTINNLDPEKSEALLNFLGINANLQDLNSKDHATMTLIEESLPLISNNDKLAAEFFARLKR
jgi:hypothetical protein